MANFAEDKARKMRRVHHISHVDDCAMGSLMSIAARRSMISGFLSGHYSLALALRRSLLDKGLSLGNGFSETSR
jgi:hypothetical protein